MRPRAVSSLRLKRVLSGRQIALCSDGGPDEGVSCQAQERDILDAVICAADEADAQRLVNEEGCKSRKFMPMLLMSSAPLKNVADMMAW